MSLDAFVFGYDYNFLVLVVLVVFSESKLLIWAENCQGGLELSIDRQRRPSAAKLFAS
jgi:hypothetical protein